MTFLISCSHYTLLASVIQTEDFFFKCGNLLIADTSFTVSQFFLMRDNLIYFLEYIIGATQFTQYSSYTTSFFSTSFVQLPHLQQPHLVNAQDYN